jgi:hypothetical protein
MKVILIEDVKSLGKKGQIVEINDGYARNFVLPKKLGLEATPKNLNDLKLKKQNDEKVAAENLAEAKAMAEKLAAVTVNAQVKVGEGGKTFGKYNITAGPSGWAWGGSWLALSPKCDNGTIARDFVKYFTVDENTAKDYALFKSEFVNNPAAMKAIVDEGSNKNPLLGGQDQFSVLYESASTIDMDGKITAFDAQIKDAFNQAVTKYAKGDIASYDDMITEFKTNAAKIEGITVE